MSDAMKASFSALVMSIASSGLMSMGLAQNPQSGKTEKNLDIARINIDMLRMLEEKTKGNLSSEEADLIRNVINDLQMKFVSASNN